METFCTRLLVGLVGNEPDPSILRYASMIARLRNKTATPTFENNGLDEEPDSSVDLIHGSEWTLDGDAEARFACVRSDRVANERSEAGTALRRQMRNQVHSFFRGFPASAPVGWDILSGNAVEKLKMLATDFESDLLLVGDSSTARRMSARLAMEAPCPVWLVPTDWAPVLRHCLVPVDFSAESADCFRAAIELARRSGAMRCVALHVVATPTIRGDTALPTAVTRQLRGTLEQFLSRIDLRGVRVDLLIEEGPSVAQVVSRVAQEHAVDLVVMATRRRSMLGGLVHPSQTARAILGCPTSFLVLKSSPSQVGLLGAILERLRSADDIQFG